MLERDIKTCPLRVFPLFFQLALQIQYVTPNFIPPPPPFLSADIPAFVKSNVWLQSSQIFKETNL